MRSRWPRRCRASNCRRKSRLTPNAAFYRAGQNQLIATLYVGNAQASGDAPDDLFKVTNVVNGADVAGTVEESGCKMTWPA